MSLSGWALALASAAVQADADGPGLPLDRPSVALTQNTYDLYTVEVTLGRQLLFSGDPAADPVPFIFDTGANTTAVPRMIAMQLLAGEDLAMDRIGHGMTSQFATDLFYVDEVDFGFGVQTLEMAVIDQAYGSVLSAAGILGSNAFGDEIIIADFPRQQLVVSGADAVRPDLRFDHSTGLVTGQARVRGIDAPVRVMIDTGAAASLINPALAALRRGSTQRSEAEISGVAEGVTQTAEQRRFFGGLTLGGLCMGPFWITVADVYAFEARGWENEPAIILGMDALGDARLTIDYGGGAVALDGVTDHVCRAR